MKKILFLLAVLTLSFNSICSQNLNQYKYVHVPLRFSFLKENDKEKNKYNLSTLSKLYMQKYGFEAYIEGDTAAPYDFVNNNCGKVFVDIEKNSTLFLTRVKVVLKDCNGQVLYTSKEGSSKEKAYSKAYNEALREAFASMSGINYKYNPGKGAGKPVAAEQPKVQPTAQSGETAAQNNSVSNTELLYAQPIQNGFQLVNTEPRVIYKIYKTSNNDIYAAVKGNISGVFIPKGNEWFFEYYQNDQLVSEKVNVRF